MKNQLQKSNPQFTLVSALPPAKETDAAGRINHFNEVAQQAGRLAIQAAIITGWLLSIEKAKRVGSFEAWCEANLTFARRTWYKYLELFAKTVASNEKATIDCPEGMREKVVAEYAAETDSKTLTELYVDLGIVKKAPSNLGGRREGAGRKPKAESVAAAAAALEQSTELAKVSLEQSARILYNEVVTDDALALIDDAFLVTFVGTLDAVYEKAHQILAARQARGA